MNQVNHVPGVVPRPWSRSHVSGVIPGVHRMIKLDDLQPNAAVRGILPDALVTVVSVQWFGSEALELTYKNPAGKVANELLYRHDESGMCQ